MKENKEPSTLVTAIVATAWLVFVVTLFVLMVIRNGPDNHPAQDNEDVVVLYPW